MYTTIVHVHVKPDHVDEFIAATEKNHSQSVKENGNCRFDILQQADDTTRFILYEAYVDQASAAAHKETSHYMEWRDTVADWMASPRQGIVHTGLFPKM